MRNKRRGRLEVLGADVVNRDAAGFDFDGNGVIRLEIGVCDRADENAILVMVVDWVSM